MEARSGNIGNIGFKKIVVGQDWYYCMLKACSWQYMTYFCQKACSWEESQKLYTIYFDKFTYTCGCPCGYRYPIWHPRGIHTVTYSQSPFWASTMEISFPRCFHMNANWGYQYAVWKPEKDLGESNIRGEKKVGIEPS